MKLQILIPQYNETDDVVKPMLDSIAIQQSIDFNDIEVLIGNDGSDIKLSNELLASYNYSITYNQYEHTSPAGTRQRLFNEATADYVMFCDADDMFLSGISLYTILSVIASTKCDMLICEFLEQVRIGNEFIFHPHKRDEVFVHGKVYRRQHIIDNKIIWREDIRYHEDGTYNLLCIHTAKSVKYCDLPLYLWRWRDNSVCRSDNLYVLKTYTRMIYSNAYLIRDLLDRKMVDKARYFVGTLVYGTYYMLNKPVWLDPMNAKYRYETEMCFKEYFKKHKALFNEIPESERFKIVAGSKNRVLKQGVLTEKFTFDEWIKHIEALE